MTSLYTFKEVAERYGVAICTVRRWAKSGKIAYIKVGGQYRVKESDLIKLEETEVQ